MSVITSNLQNNATRDLASSQDLIARSLARLATLAQTANPSDATSILGGLGLPDSASGGLQAASAGVQTSLTSVQTTGGYLDGMGSLLKQIGDLAAKAGQPGTSASDLATYRQELSSLQDQLRAAIGGTTSEIGGDADVNSPVGSFKGADLFGPGSGATANPANLRHGAMLNLISQDGTGGFTLDVTDSDAGATIAGAARQVAAARSAVGASQSSLELAAASLQVQQQNLLSAFTPIGDATAAQQATLFATGNIVGQGATALAAQAGQSPATVLNLVQF